jgi:CheY-like chemotaxis protein
MMEHILLAEDNEMCIKLVLYGLKGFNVDIARNGKEAVDLFSNHHYDLVIMDIRLPVLDGIAASKEIRKIEKEKQKKKGVVILGMTADWIPDIMDESRKAGINGFLPKPFRPKELADLITELYLKHSRDSELVSLPEE